MDIFEEKGIKPMLIAQQREAFDSPDWIYEVKLDGIRCVVYLDEQGTDLHNKRDKKLLPYLSELAEIHKQVKGKCILDGEVFVLRDGVTDFYEIQRRVMMSDPFKIKLAAAKYPAAFVAFDLLYLDGKLVTDLPLTERKKMLSELVAENSFISVSRYVENNGISLFEASKERGLEGIVAKRKDSKYFLDKRTKDWIKCKVLLTEDCVICGYIQKEKNMTSLVLGQYENGKLIYRGHVTLGVSQGLLRQHDYHVVADCPFDDVPRGNENAVWLASELVCIVESMPTEHDSFRQPVFKGIRDDKRAEEC